MTRRAEVSSRRNGSDLDDFQGEARSTETDAGVSAPAWISAAKALLDRSWGRPEQRVELEEDPGPSEASALRVIRPGDPDFEPLESEPGAEDAA